MGDRSAEWADIADVAMAAEALYVAMRRVRSAADDSDQPLSVAQMTLIEPLLDERELPVGQLAARADVSVPTATRMLKHLEARGLIERRRSRDDDRKVLVQLSQMGAEAATARRERLRQQQIERLARLSPGERAAMARQLRKLARIVAAPSTATDAPRV
jgi:DNA-binding MarR family transcriptional regulator